MKREQEIDLYNEILGDHVGKPWGRQSKETANMYKAFVDYVVMGPGRSQRALWAKYADRPKRQQPAKSPETINSWSRKNDWVARSRAYDAYTQKARLDRLAELRESVIDEELKDYEEMLKQFRRTLNALAGNDDKAMTPSALNDLMNARKKITELSRLALGMPMTINESQGNADETPPLTIIEVIRDGPAPGPQPDDDDVITVESEPAQLPDGKR